MGGSTPPWLDTPLGQTKSTKSDKTKAGHVQNFQGCHCLRKKSLSDARGHKGLVKLKTSRLETIFTLLDVPPVNQQNVIVISAISTRQNLKNSNPDRIEAARKF